MNEWIRSWTFRTIGIHPNGCNLLILVDKQTWMQSDKPTVASKWFDVAMMNWTQALCVVVRMNLVMASTQFIDSLSHNSLFHKCLPSVSFIIYLSLSLSLTFSPRIIVSLLLPEFPFAIFAFRFLAALLRRLCRILFMSFSINEYYLSCNLKYR